MAVIINSRPRRSFVKKVFLKISQNLLKKSYLIYLRKVFDSTSLDEWISMKYVFLWNLDLTIKGFNLSLRETIEFTIHCELWQWIVYCGNSLWQLVVYFAMAG